MSFTELLELVLTMAGGDCSCWPYDEVKFKEQKETRLRKNGFLSLWNRSGILLNPLEGLEWLKLAFPEWV